jgi:MFS family permease
VATATQPPSGQTPEGHEQQPAPTGPQTPNLPSAQAPAPSFEAAGAPNEDLIETQKRPTLRLKVQAFRERHAMAEMAAFFFLGFLYDAFTLSRIDDRISVVQQGVYLAVLGMLLFLEQRWSGETKPSGWLAKAWRFNEDVLHFFFGSLLSSFTLLYFKSASSLTSLLFLVVVFGLLVGNELPRFRALGPLVRVAIFSFCVTSYFAYLLPVLFGFLSAWLFLLAVVVGCGAVLGLFGVVRRWNGGNLQTVFQRVALPGLAVQGALLLLYLLHVIPPVPLALQFAGIYHDVKVVRGDTGREYHLSYEAPTWKFWNSGSQDFFVRPGDKAWYFVRIFAPKHFQDRVTFRWYYDDPDKGWVERGSFKTRISASSDEGFRTMAYTSNPKPGDWSVSVETEDGREIGSMSFTVLQDERTEPRELQVTKQ